MKESEFLNVHGLRLTLEDLDKSLDSMLANLANGNDDVALQELDDLGTEDKK